MKHTKKIISFLVLIPFLFSLLTPLVHANSTEEEDRDIVETKINLIKNPDPTLPSWISEQKGQVGIIFDKMFNTNGRIKKIFLETVYVGLSGSRLLRYDTTQKRFVDSSVRDNWSNVWIGWWIDENFALNVTGDMSVSGNITAADPTLDSHVATKDYVDTVSWWGHWMIKWDDEIYYNTAYVGIGNNNPSERLSVTNVGEDVASIDLRSASADTILTLESSDSTIAGGSYFLRALDWVAELFSIRGDGYTSINGNLELSWNPTSNLMVWNRAYNDTRYINVWEAIPWDDIIDGTVDASEIEDNAITSAKINDATITAADLWANSVGTSEVIDNSLSTNDLADNSVAAAEIQSSAVGSDEVINNSLTASDLAPNSVGNSELIATPTFSNVISNDPTAANHAATKNYVDTLVTAWISWKAPVPNGSTPAGTYGTCDTAKEWWTTYNISNDAVYLCNGSAWEIIGNTASIPYATTSSAWKVQLSGDITGTWNNVQLAADSVWSAEVVADSLTATDLAANSVWDSELIDNPRVTYLDVAAANGNGLRFWNGANSYKIHMWNAAENQYGPVTDYSIKTNMSNTIGRWWTWWVTGATPVAAIEATTGDAQFAGTITADTPTAAGHLTTKAYVDALPGDGDAWWVTWEDIASNNISRDGTVSIWPDASGSSNATLTLDKHHNVNANSRQLHSTTTITSPIITADRQSYGAQFNLTNNKTENIGAWFDSDASGVYSYVDTTGTNTFRYNRWVYGLAYNNSTAASGLGTLYWVQGSAGQAANSGNINTIYGVHGNARGDTTASTTSSISNAYGTYGSVTPYRSNITNAYGLMWYTRTANGYAWDITNAYGVYADVYDDSDDGGQITTWRAGYFITRRRGTGNLMTTAYGIQVDANDAATVYGIRVDADDTDATNNYGLWIDARNGWSNSYGILWERWDWYLQEDGDGWVWGTWAGWDLVLWGWADMRMWHDGTNSYIRNHTGDLYIGDNGTDDVILSNNDGRVGIWTNAPADTLDVDGNIRLSSAYPQIIKMAGNFSVFEATSGSLLHINKWNWTNVAIDGNIGMWDQTPDWSLKLDVEWQIGASEYCDENGNNCRDILDLSPFWDSDWWNDLKLEWDNADVRMYSYSNAFGWKADLELLRARWTDIDPDPVAAGDNIWSIRWMPYDGAEHIVTASVSAEITWTPAEWDVDTELVFTVTSDDSYSNTGDEKTMVIQSDGDVGIWVDDPWYRLELPNTWNTAWRWRANAWHTYSSRRWKENIKPIENALEKTEKLQGITYNWKNEQGGMQDIWFVAEEVWVIFPEMVEWEDNWEDAKWLAYDRITAVLVEAVKEISQMIKEIFDTNDSQQEEIDELKRQVEELKTLIEKDS